MMFQHLQTYEVEHAAGAKVDIGIDPVDGTFRAQVGDADLNADSLSRLKSLIRDTVRGSKLEAPFVHAKSGGRGVMRGFHASQHAILVTWEGGRKDQLSGHADVFRPDSVSDEEIDRMAALKKEIDTAQATLDAMIDDLKRSGRMLHASDLMAEALGLDLFDYRRPWEQNDGDPA